MLSYGREKKKGMLFTVHTTIELGFFSAGPRTKIWSDHKLMFERTPHAHDDQVTL